MTQVDALIRRSSLLNRLVLDKVTTEEIGKVAQLWLDIQTHQVVTVTCKAGFLGRNHRSFGWTQIETIGADSILVKLQTGIELETPDSAEVMVGTELWTDGGARVGQLVDYGLDPQTGAVKYYLFASDKLQGLTDGTYRLAPAAILSAGPKRVIAATTAVQNAEQDTEGLGPKLAQAADFLRDDYAQTQKDWQSAVKEGKTLAEQVQVQAKKLTGQAKEKLAEAAEQMQETTQKLSHQAREQLANEKWSEKWLPSEDKTSQVGQPLDDSVFDFEEPISTPDSERSQPQPPAGQ